MGDAGVVVGDGTSDLIAQITESQFGDEQYSVLIRDFVLIKVVLAFADKAGEVRRRSQVCGSAGSNAGGGCNLRKTISIEFWSNFLSFDGGEGGGHGHTKSLFVIKIVNHVSAAAILGDGVIFPAGGLVAHGITLVPVIVARTVNRDFIKLYGTCGYPFLQLGGRVKDRAAGGGLINLINNGKIFGGKRNAVVYRHVISGKSVRHI